MGVPVVIGGDNLPSPIGIGLTDRPKIGGAMAPPAPPGTTGLCMSHIQENGIANCAAARVPHNGLRVFLKLAYFFKSFFASQHGLIKEHRIINLKKLIFDLIYGV